MSDSCDVIIIGGGIAGLAVAYELQQRGVSYRLFERAARVGGVILTERTGGFTFDAGPDALLVQKSAAVALCRELGLGDRLFPTSLPRTAYIMRAGRLHPLPEGSMLGIPRNVSALAATRLFSLAGKVRMAAELFVPRRTDGEDESIASFIGRRFGAEAVTYLADPLLAGIHAGEVNDLSMRALFPRFLDAERKHGSVLRAFRQIRQPKTSDGAFRSLPDGLEELVRALAGVLRPDRIALGAGVRSVARLGAGYEVVLESGDRFSAPAVVACAPAWAAAAILRPADEELARLCARIPYASSATVTLGYRREDVAHPLRGSGYVVPRVEGTIGMAGSWISSKWRDRAPEGHVLLRAFVGGARDPGALRRSDDEILAAAGAELARVHGITGPPVLARLHRWERANAQHNVGHLDVVSAIEARLARLPGLFVTGSGFRGVGVPDCVADGRKVAAEAAAWVASRRGEVA
jgi:oxygen-dependent protoporphyrinogen oxidase